MFDGFTRARIAANGMSINVRHGGSGPPILLLHGYPQTHVMWHKVAPTLAEHYAVVAPDLRGYGDSDKPPAAEGDLSVYCKRTTAQDQVAVMASLGFDRFHVVGHDRGARVAQRMALDHPERVRSFTSLDVVPSQAGLRPHGQPAGLCLVSLAPDAPAGAAAGNADRQQCPGLSRLLAGTLVCHRRRDYRGGVCRISALLR